MPAFKRAVLATAPILFFMVPFVISMAASANDRLLDAVQTVETRLDARVGVSILNVENGREWQYRADERFPLTSTFKLLACAAVLHKVDRESETLDRRITYRSDDLVTYSPITEKHVDSGMTIGELCEAALHLSDNTAANLVLDVLGGPDVLTAYLRDIGDDVTRLDRIEPDLNAATPGDARDTTTPNAMRATLTYLLLGDALSLESRQILEDWLTGNQVGGPLLRAGLPDDWKIADRTGAGGFGSRAIVAVIWPPERKPVIVAIYITQTSASMEERNAAIADLGQEIAAAIMR
ncbi:MAG: class A beta-lactamase [Thalassospira sp.]|jgi:beta-lactamase class A/beta-lactamase class A CARB-5|uniref:Beta-lactamase n=2 Tax=Thalassospiraceae TaxID=2844866 RepID=A0ABR5Y485_9PROT|nr:class A beta-lactamase [Thalassospira xiamenensis]MAL30409.1 class A beta-lactamase [Thalassospira sp.]MBR9778463.1 class A beta-lactamase [Rhodospirillales bacterium]OCK07784.1 Beta-lactamase [Thalassospira sp. KO164]PXX32738.1 beta-lactamase class A/beta-lactamase class A CARB-5 [Thalassospira sp. 11-3]QPL36436.1 class A beta-lactamase [Thalassospira sp. B30-1]SEE23196.1 beta-lactamase class A [Thalassospira permensis]|tara:strand:+ start:1806 stop:2687 length:882 start_codon:yes stop_codon:yes gene_type:complete